MKTIFVVCGTRPEAIKLAPVILQLKKIKYFDVRVVGTGQHTQMTTQMLNLFGIKLDYDLAIMKPSQGLGQVTAILSEKLNCLFLQDKPDIVLVQGDTTSAFTAALIAFYHKIKVVHIEAGLRTKNRYEPFPEETNRRLISCLTDYHWPLAVLSFSLFPTLVQMCR